MENASRDGETDDPGDEVRRRSSAPAGRRTLTAALLVAMMVTAVEQLVVSPAMPTIIAKLKGFEIYPWVISAYLLAATVSTPIYGKLADLFGRKRVLLFGLALFTMGSVLSGTSMSMGQLIAMRTIQGLGAGAVGPIVLTILGDVFTLQERARVQGLFSAVWGLSSIGGPLIGGYLTDYIGWRCVFLMCVPFSIAAIILLIYHVSEPKVERTVAPIDWAGAALLTTGLSALLWVVLDGSRRGWAVNISLLSAAAILMVLFVIREHRAIDPILPLDLMMQAGDRGFAGRQPALRRHPVRARRLCATLRAGRARGQRDVGRAGTHAAVHRVGHQRGPGRPGRHSSWLSPSGDDRLGHRGRWEPVPGNRSIVPELVASVLHRRPGRSWGPGWGRLPSASSWPCRTR